MHADTRKHRQGCATVTELFKGGIILKAFGLFQPKCM